MKTQRIELNLIFKMAVVGTMLPGLVLAAAPTELIPKAGMAIEAHAKDVANAAKGIFKKESNIVTQQAEEVKQSGGMWRIIDKFRTNEVAEAEANGVKVRLVDAILNRTNGLIEDIWVKAKNGDVVPAVDRETEKENIIVALKSNSRDGVFVHGAPGVGRTAVIESIADDMAHGRIEGLEDVRMIRVPGDSAEFADIKQFKTELQKISKLAKEKKLAGTENLAEDARVRFVVYVDDPSVFVKGEKSASEAKIAPYLRAIRQELGPDAKFMFEGSGDKEMLKKAYSFLNNRWVLQDIREFSPEEAVKALHTQIAKISADEDINISESIVKKADEWCRKFSPDLAQPGCAIRLIKEALSRKREIVSKGQPAILAQAERTQISKLAAEKAELSENGVIAGRYAQERLPEIDKDILKVQEKIKEIESHTIELSNLVKKLGGKAPADRIKELDAELEKVAAAIRETPNDKKLIAQSRKLIKDKNEVTQAVNELSTLTEGDLAMQIHRTTGIPYADIFSSTKELSFEEFMSHVKANFIGQEHVYPILEEIYYATKNRLDRGLNEPEFKMAMIGDAGTGKTTLANLIAKLKGGKLITVHGSDFKEKHTISLLKGSPPGYVGFDEGSQVLNEVRETPKSIFFTDEADKMETGIYNEANLQATDERGGIVKDTRGREANFRDTIWLEAANWGENILTPDMPEEEVRQWLIDHGYMTEAKARRLDRIVVFRKFGEGDKEKVMFLNLKTMDLQYRETVRISVAADESLVSFLTSKMPEGPLNASRISAIIKKYVNTPMKRIISEGEYINAKGVKVQFPVKKGQKVLASFDENVGIVFSILK